MNKERTKYIYTIVPSSDGGYKVYYSTEELYGIEPIKGKLLGWFADMRVAESFVAIEELKNGMIQDAKNNNFKGEDLPF